MEQLKKLRKERDLTQKQVSDALKIQRATYTRYEIGEREPDNKTLNKLADFYDVTTDYLLERTNLPNPNKEPDYLRKIRIAAEKMDEKQRQKMLNILEISFEEYFNEKE
jgi:transcriptional regulator with XRE-family HTH domain